MTRCAAFGCNTDSRQDRTIKYHFFTFPANKIILEKWFAAMSQYTIIDGVIGKFNPTIYSSLCHKHFEDSCYTRMLSVTALANIEYKRTLKPDAVPTIFPDIQLAKGKVLNSIYSMESLERSRAVHLAEFTLSKELEHLQGCKWIYIYDKCITKKMKLILWSKSELPKGYEQIFETKYNVIILKKSDPVQEECTQRLRVALKQKLSISDFPMRMENSNECKSASTSKKIGNCNKCKMSTLNKKGNSNERKSSKQKAISNEQKSSKLKAISNEQKKSSKKMVTSSEPKKSSRKMVTSSEPKKSSRKMETSCEPKKSSRKMETSCEQKKSSKKNENANVYNRPTFPKNSQRNQIQQCIRKCHVANYKVAPHMESETSNGKAEQHKWKTGFKQQTERAAVRAKRKLNVLTDPERVAVQAKRKLNVLTDPERAEVRAKRKLNVLTDPERAAVRAKRKLNVLTDPERAAVRSKRKLNVLTDPERAAVRAKRKLNVVTGIGEVEQELDKPITKSIQTRSSQKPIKRRVQTVSSQRTLEPADKQDRQVRRRRKLVSQDARETGTPKRRKVVDEDFTTRNVQGGLFPLDLPSELPACKMESTSSPSHSAEPAYKMESTSNSSHNNSSRNYGDTIAATSAVTPAVPLNSHLSFVKTETGDLQCKRCHQRVSDIKFIHEFQKHLETCGTVNSTSNTMNLVVVTCVQEYPNIMEGIVHSKGLSRTDVNQKLTESDQASKDINSNLDSQFVKKEVLDHELTQDIESAVSIEPVNVTDTQFVKKEVLEHELKQDIESAVTIEPVNVTDTQFVKKEVLEHELKQDIESAVSIEPVNVTDTQFVKKEVLEHELKQDIESAVTIEPVNATDTQFVKKEVSEQELKQNIESAVTIEPVNATEHFAMNEPVEDTEQKIDTKTDSKEVYVSNTNNNCECDIDNTRGISYNFITSAISRENMLTVCDSYSQTTNTEGNRKVNTCDWYGQTTNTERNRNVNPCVDSENCVSDLENLGIKIELNEDFFED